MYNRNLSATNSIVTRQFVLDDWYTHKLIFTIPSVIQISSIDSRFILGKPRLACSCILCHLTTTTTVTAPDWSTTLHPPVTYTNMK